MLKLMLQLFGDDPDGGLSLGSLLNEAAGGDPEVDDVGEEPTPEASTPEETDPEAADPEAEPAADTDTTADTKPAAKTKSNPVKDLRDQLTLNKNLVEKIDNTIQRLTDGDYEFKLKDFRDDKGKIDYDALIEAMDKEDVQRQATNKGVSPEVQAEINRIQQEKVEIQKQRLQIAMDKALISLRMEHSLKPEDVNKFFADAVASQRNPYQWIAQGGNLQDLYLILNRDAIMKAEITKAVEEERAKWEKDRAKQTKTHATNPAASHTETPPATDANSLAAFLSKAADKK